MHHTTTDNGIALIVENLSFTRNLSGVALDGFSRLIVGETLVFSSFAELHEFAPQNVLLDIFNALHALAEKIMRDRADRF